MTNENTAAEAEASAMGFDSLNLLEPVQQAIDELGYQSPSPIQAQSIPFLIDGRDILAVAQTGTGKTAAFALPLLAKIDVNIKAPQLLVLAPTRELAIQVAEAFKSYAKYIKGFKVLPIYGGADFKPQLKALERGVHVVVGTPGRVMDHMRRNTLKLQAMKALVLDEADEMLRMGFIDDVEWVLEQMPEGHQTALFSATMPAPIKKIANTYLQNPAEVMIKVKTTTAETITQRYLITKGHEKGETLCRILEAEPFDAAIVFVRTKNATLEVVEKLQSDGYRAEALNGDIAQNQREKTVNQLKRGQIDIVVATDVAARGLDVERISHVFNYDVPFDTESYVHRIGRTGRAGREGEAILFLTGREKNMLRQIERATKQSIEEYEFPSLEILNKRKIDALITKLQTRLDGNCSEYEKLVGDLLEHSDYSLDDLLIAFISEAFNGKPFYAKAFKPAGSRENKRKDERKKKHEQQHKKDGKTYKDIKLERYKLAVGSEHGVEKRDIVGAIANEADISSKYMGKIIINDDHSYIDLPEAMPKEVFQTLKKVWIRGQQLNIELSGKADSDGFSPRGDREDRGDRGDRKPGNRKPRKRSGDAGDSGASNASAGKKPSHRKSDKSAKAKKPAKPRKEGKDVNTHKTSAKKANATNAKSQSVPRKRKKPEA
jgi:ATP-dependent RNA helicase DeaD